jgi:hypothetical protein
LRVAVEEPARRDPAARDEDEDAAAGSCSREQIGQFARKRLWR